MLSKDKRAEIKQLMLEAMESTRADIVDLKELTRPIAPDDAIGRVSRMDAINNKSINDAGLRKAEAKLHKLQRAFSMIDDEHFGLCGACGGDIPVGRLMLMPESRFCVPCASKR